MPTLAMITPDEFSFAFWISRYYYLAHMDIALELNLEAQAAVEQGDWLHATVVESLLEDELRFMSLQADAHLALTEMRLS